MISKFQFGESAPQKQMVVYIGQQRELAMTMCISALAYARSAWRRRGMSKDPSHEQQGIAGSVDVSRHTRGTARTRVHPCSSSLTRSHRPPAVLNNRRTVPTAPWLLSARRQTLPTDEDSGWVMPSHHKQHTRLTPSAEGECGSIEMLVEVAERGSTDKMALIRESVIGNDCTVCVWHPHSDPHIHILTLTF